MTRAEISGWLQVIIGLVGLYFTVTNSAPALNALSSLSAGQGLPAEFDGAQGFIKVFLLILALSVLLSLVLIGVAILLAAVFRGLGAARPVHTAFSLMMSLLFAACGLTAAVYGNSTWVFAILFMLSCWVIAGIAGVSAGNDPEGDPFWVCLFLLGAASVVVGGLSQIGLNPTPVATNNEARAETLTPSA